MFAWFIKKPFALIPIVMAVAIALVSLLAWIALRPTNEKNGFNRKFINLQLVTLNVLEKDEIVTGIAGATTHHIYFKTSNPAKLFVTDNNLQNGYFRALNVPANQKMRPMFYTVIDSPQVIIMYPNISIVIKGSLDGTSPIVQRSPVLSFTRAVIIGTDSYVVRGFDDSTKEDQIFVKKNLSTGEIFRKNKITPFIRDGGISTDGLFHYDSLTQLLIYVSFYCNQIICLDTNMNIVYKAHTIDTVSTYQIRAGAVSSSKTFTNTGPSRVINGLSCVNLGKLYNSSKLKADNETDRLFGISSTIDKYDLKTGKYEGSFYIPRYYKRETIKQFKVLDGVVIVLYKNHIVKYSLDT